MNKFIIAGFIFLSFSALSMMFLEEPLKNTLMLVTSLLALISLVIGNKMKYKN